MIFSLCYRYLSDSVIGFTYIVFISETLHWSTNVILNHCVLQNNCTKHLLSLMQKCSLIDKQITLMSWLFLVNQKHTGRPM